MDIHTELLPKAPAIYAEHSYALPLHMQLYDMYSIYYSTHVHLQKAQTRIDIELLKATGEGCALRANADFDNQPSNLARGTRLLNKQLQRTRARLCASLCDVLTMAEVAHLVESSNDEWTPIELARARHLHRISPRAYDYIRDVLLFPLPPKELVLV